MTKRGHSKAHQAKYDFKKNKAQATKGKKSLRKELAPQPREKTRPPCNQYQINQSIKLSRLIL